MSERRVPAVAGSRAVLGRRPLLALALAGTAGAAACAPTTSAGSPSPGTSASGAATAPPATASATSGSAATPSAPGSSADPGSASTTSPSTAAGPGAGAVDLSAWSVEEKAGQLLMVGVDASTPAASAPAWVGSLHLGGVFLSGRSTAPSDQVRALADALTAQAAQAATEASRGTPLLVATDQEGGSVQVLSGPGFSRIPSALDQAALGTAGLATAASTWAQELASAGVTMNLAPVADLVDGPDPAANSGIGQWGREYGRDAATVSACAGTVMDAMRGAGVIPVLKHFPGQGRVRANTDTAVGVTDATTTRSGDSAVGVFADLVARGAPVVMVSSVVYSLIDPSAPAVFSPVVVTDLLRGDLGFTGVVMTDDVAAAAQVQAWTPGQRAVSAIRAGCDIVLASADSSVADEIASALVAEAESDGAFASLIDAAVRRVLTLKGAGR